MRVADLIAQLKVLDPQTEVFTFSEYDHVFYTPELRTEDKLRYDKRYFDRSRPPDRRYFIEIR